MKPWNDGRSSSGPALRGTYRCQQQVAAPSDPSCLPPLAPCTRLAGSESRENATRRSLVVRSEKGKRLFRSDRNRQTSHGCSSCYIARPWDYPTITRQLSAATSALEATTKLLRYASSHRDDIAHLSRDEWRSQGQWLKQFACGLSNRDRYDYQVSLGILLQHVERRREEGSRASATCVEVAEMIDIQFHQKYPYELEAHYDRNGVVCADSRFQIRADDPLTYFPTGDGNQRANEGDPSRTTHLRLASSEVENCDVQLSFELSGLSHQFTQLPNRYGIVQPIAGRDDWVETLPKLDGKPEIVEDQRYTDRVLRLLDLAGEMGAHIALMPEGVCFAELIDGIASQAKRADRQGPTLIHVCGSSYVPGGTNDVFENESEIVVQHESFPTRAGTRAVAGRKNRRAFANMEPIPDRSDNPSITVFAIGHVKMAVILCADFLEPRIRSVLTALGVELVLVPTMTLRKKHVFDFITTADQFVRDGRGVVVLSNAAVPGRPLEVAGAVVHRSAANPTIVDDEFARSWGTRLATVSRPGVAAVDIATAHSQWRSRPSPAK